MTFIPHFFPGQKISTLLHKSPRGEKIQVDILILTAAQQFRVGNQQILVLIVVVETFSRLMWCHPFARVDVQPGNAGGVIRRRIHTTAEHATAAFARAFVHNGAFARSM